MRDARSELFLRATASFAGEDSFYEEAAVRDGRIRELVSELATDVDGLAVRATYRGHDRVMIFTDMQTFPDRVGWSPPVGDVSASVPAHIPVYGFDLVGYRHSAMAAAHGNRHELGGLPTRLSR